MIAHRQVLHAIAATCVLSALLGVWRLAYPRTDAAGLPLLVLGLLLGASHMMLVREPYRVCMRAVVRRESCLSRWLTGQCRAVRGALLFACAAVPLLAWLALRIDMLETLTFAVLALLASVAYGGLRTYMQRHAHPPFAQMAAAKTVNWLVALPCVPLLAWLNYHFVEYSAAIVAAGSMAEALELGIAQAVPGRQSWLAEGWRCWAPGMRSSCGPSRVRAYRGWDTCCSRWRRRW